MKNISKIFTAIFVLMMLVIFISDINTQAATKKSRVKYELKNGTLTISGKGEMPKDMTFKSNKKIKKVVIKKGVTTISEKAFEGCTKLTFIKIPNTVTKMGLRCFYNTGLKEIVVPKSVNHIGAQCLGSCEKLQKITLPGNTKDKYPVNLERYPTRFTTYPVKTVRFSTQLNPEILMTVMAENIEVSKNDKKYKSINGVVYSKDGKELVRYPAGRNEIVIENGCEIFNTEAICYYAYEEDIDRIIAPIDKAKKLVIPESVKK